jgi:hypothetical protein
MNCMYPSPWLPHSVEDPWSLVDLSCESPTFGIWLGINKMALRVSGCLTFHQIFLLS